ncbi:slipin family protein [Marinivivus vitaminiproducens]|uniref:slipin family protein n=1 Tax=Marinivivus vitaminiproducens TaxID=3035935 RepID=UPI0027A7AE4E|nr:slipin family protein [Geminicoccaceae bacterium SCSIO 64248]
MNLLDYLPFAPALVIPLVVIAFILITGLRILREYERAVVFQLGRFWKVKGPGLIVIIPILQQMQRVDIRTRVEDVPHQDIISRDNVLVKVNAVVYFRVIDAGKAVINVENYQAATSQLAQTTLRSVLGQHDLDDMLAERDSLNDRIRAILDEQTDAWGIKVANVELKHVDIDESMIRVIARQAEAERVRRAKIIEAEGEQQSAQKFLEAAEILGGRPEAMQLRYLATLTTIANERSNTIVFPFPGELASLFGSLADKPSAQAQATAPDSPAPVDDTPRPLV